MKATFPLKLLAEAVRAASAIVPSRTTKDILKNVRVVASGDSASVSASDSEIGIVCYVRGVQTPQSGAVLLPCDKLTKILSEVSGETILIELINGVAHLTAGRSKFKIQTEDEKGFPPVKEFTESAFFTVKATEMKRMLKRTVFCCNDRHQNKSLGGVCLQFEPTKITAAAFDGNCLSVDSVSCGTEGSPEIPGSRMIAPLKMASAIERVLDIGSVDLFVSQNQIMVRCEDFVLTGQLVSGQFPPFEKVIGRAQDCEIPMPVDELCSVTRQASITTVVETSGVRYSFRGGVMTATGSGADVGDSTIETPVAFDGTADIRLDPEWLLKAIRLMPSGQSVQFGITYSGARIGLADGWVYCQAAQSLE